jgi:N-ethylmaleimide reductase
MDTPNQKSLFYKVTTHSAEFSNAIVMAPMTRSRAVGSLPNESIATYYAQRASAGLIITEGTAPSPNGLGYARIPGIYNKQQVEAWKPVTRAVHDKGGKIYAQLMHVGRIAHSANMPAGSRIIAPSAIAANGDMWTDEKGLQPNGKPEAMSLADIKNTINEFAQAAQNAIDAGFDGVELHGANGYLLEQFLNPHTNQRTDTYGGSAENRIRFVLEVTTAVIKMIGCEKVGLRVSPYSGFNDMPPYSDTFNTYLHLAREVSKLNIVYLHLVDYAARATEEGRNLIRAIRENFKNILILNGGYTKERALSALQEEGADMISFGSSFIANPDLPHRLKNDIPLSNPDPNTFYTPGNTGYIDYAFSEQRAF